jgi:O-antigen ligase
MNNKQITSPSPSMINPRLLIVYFASISVSLGTAVSALGRFALYILALTLLIRNLTTTKPRNDWPKSQWFENWSAAILMTIGFMAASILWSDGDITKAAGSWTRHARLLTIALLWILIRDKKEAHQVLRVFVIAHLFVVASSWMLILGLPVPWATASDAHTHYAAFGSYLEQSIMAATVAFILWHQRAWIFGKNGQMLAITAAIITVFQMLGFLVGRSGYLVFIALASMAILYQLPKRWRWMAVMIPFALAAIIVTGSKTARDRIDLVRQEVTAFAQHSDINSSSGLRLILWETSLHAIAEKPWFGSGSGSWNTEFRRLKHDTLAKDLIAGDDPHQMFLLWATEGGVVGLALLLGILLSLYTRSRSLDTSDARSLQSALTALVVAGFTTSTIYGIGFGDFCCMLIGILISTGHQDSAIAAQVELTQT